MFMSHQIKLALTRKLIRISLFRNFSKNCFKILFQKNSFIPRFFNNFLSIWFKQAYEKLKIKIWKQTYEEIVNQWILLISLRILINYFLAYLPRFYIISFWHLFNIEIACIINVFVIALQKWIKIRYCWMKAFHDVFIILFPFCIKHCALMHHVVREIIVLIAV